MPRVLGIDPGTISIDFAVLDEGRPAGFRRLPTATLARSPQSLRETLGELGRFDLVAAPSGYGLPLARGEALKERDLRLAFLAEPGAGAGILGLRRAVAELLQAGQPVVLLPGVIHLPSVPLYRKANRIDMGTADKLCATALAIAESAHRRNAAPAEVSLILLELGGAFSAAIAVEAGAVVDGLGGTSGPLGFLGAGALDGEAVALAGTVAKDALFTGGAGWIAGEPDLDPAMWSVRATREPRLRTAWLAYLESAAKVVTALRLSAPSARDLVLSGRLAHVPDLAEELRGMLKTVAPDLRVTESRPSVPGVTSSAGAGTGPKEAARGAALLADGLCGGPNAELVAALRLKEAAGSVLDHLYWPPAREGAARFMSDLQ